MNMRNKLTNKFNTCETDRLLAFVDIIAAINFYGITELLDTIGEESLRAHLEMDKPDQIEQLTDKPKLKNRNSNN